MKRETCILRKCSNRIDMDPSNKRHLTCSNDCASVHHLNQMVWKRAKKLKRGVVQCIVNDCSRDFVDNDSGETRCPGCRDSIFTNTDLVYHGDVAKEPIDHRTRVCKPKNVICADYSTCSDPDEKGRITFKYEKNGGVNCYRKPETRHLTRGDSFATHSVNTP